MKQRVVLQITAEIDSTSAWGDDCPVSQIMNQAASDARSWTFFVTKGAGAQSEQIKATVKVSRIELEPDATD